MNTKNLKMTRRSAMHKLAVGAASVVAGPLALRASAQDAEKGPLVWLDMDQKELNDAYSQFIYAPNIGQVIDRWGSNSALVRARIGEPATFSYGTDPVETLDVFRTNRAKAPVHIFIHGGAWQQGSSESYSFPAEVFTNAGVHYVVPNFSWIQDVGDSLYPIVEQLRAAIAWVYHNADQFGGDPERIFLSGHSSGGHLAGMLLVTDWQRYSDLPADVIKAALCCSGIFDMEPVRLSARGDYIKFTDAMEHDMSPIRHIDNLHTPLVVAYGSYETPEFKRQSIEFAKAVSTAGKPVEVVVAENYNHFEVIETLANPNGILGRAVLEQMNTVQR